LCRDRASAPLPVGHLVPMSGHYTLATGKIETELRDVRIEWRGPPRCLSGTLWLNCGSTIEKMPTTIRTIEHRGWKLRMSKAGTWKVTPPPGTSSNEEANVRLALRININHLKMTIEAIEAFKLTKQEALFEGNYALYLSYLPNHDLLEAFLTILPRLNDHQYWTLLRQVWIMDDFWKQASFMGKTDIQKHRSNLKILVSSPRPCRELFMSDEERAKLNEMPDILKVYRGFKLLENADGFSWTTNIETAKWFAKRFNGNMIASGDCVKDDTIAYLAVRDENEIVIDPKYIINRTILTFSE